MSKCDHDVAGATSARFCFCVLGLSPILCLILIPLLVWLLPVHSTGQLSRAAHVRQVIFPGSRPIIGDEGLLCGAPQWDDADGDGTANRPGENHFAVCYPAGTTMSVAAVFRCPESRAPRPVWIRGATEDGFEFCGTGEAVGGWLVTPVMRATEPLPPQVQARPSWRIRWELSWDQGATFQAAGQSDHRLYVTLAEPRRVPIPESVLDIACRGAHAATNAAQAVAGIWAEFTQRDPDGVLSGVRRKAVDGHNQPDGRRLRYWVEREDPLLRRVPMERHSMLAMLRPAAGDPLDGVGTCQAWTELFCEVLGAVGLHQATSICLVPPAEEGGCFAGFWMNERRAGAQGNRRPPRGMINHSVVELDGALYDPSYGTGPFRGATLQEAVLAWKRVTVAAFVPAAQQAQPRGRIKGARYSPSSASGGG